MNRFDSSLSFFFFSPEWISPFDNNTTAPGGQNEDGEDAWIAINDLGGTVGGGSGSGDSYSAILNKILSRLEDINCLLKADRMGILTELTMLPNRSELFSYSIATNNELCLRLKLHANEGTLECINYGDFMGVPFGIIDSYDDFSGTTYSSDHQCSVYVCLAYDNAGSQYPYGIAYVSSLYPDSASYEMTTFSDLRVDPSEWFYCALTCSYMLAGQSVSSMYYKRINSGVWSSGITTGTMTKFRINKSQVTTTSNPVNNFLPIYMDIGISFCAEISNLQYGNFHDLTTTKISSWTNIFPNVIDSKYGLFDGSGIAISSTHTADTVFDSGLGGTFRGYFY